jgi:DNA replication and repair protein RecF
VQRGFKKIEKNHKRIMDRKDLINTVPCILYCHEDLDFVTGDLERRRFFLDQTLSLNDVVFIELSRNYKRVLKNRNTLLKDLQEQHGDADLLNVYDRQAVQYGVDIQNRRKVLIAVFNAIFTPLYDEVAGIDGVRLVYAPSWKEQDERPITRDEAASQIAAKRGPDIALGTTLSGPHRDRVIFMRHGQPFSPGASTGQKRLTAILLRTAQAVYYRREAGKAPVLLMDDVLLELDPEKRRRVQAVLPEYDQLFCTFLAGEPYEKYQKINAKVFTIREGTWVESTT